MRKACKPTVNGNGALQDLYNECLKDRIDQLEVLLREGYDYVAVSGISATIGFLNVAFQNVGCQNTALTTITLPSIATVGKMEITIKDEAINDTSLDMIINPDGSDTIENLTTLRYSRNGNKKGASITLYNDNSTSWYLK